jgi:hypothetical protein
MSLFAFLAGCGGNAFTNGNNGVVTPTPTTPVVPASISLNIDAVSFDPNPANPRLLVQIKGLDTTPVVASWARRPSMDRQGYLAFAVQEDALDRLYIGLAKQSADGSVRSVVAGDGLQFNKNYQGASYERVGTLTFPSAAGMVSYGGAYIGLLNGYGDGSGLMVPPAGTNPANLASEAARVTGTVFMNATFSDNQINGAITGRQWLEAIGNTIALEDIIMVPTEVLRNQSATNGTFTGQVARPIYLPADGAVIGDYGGVLGGVGAGYLAGGLRNTNVYMVDGSEILGATEVGGFVLTQCGLPGAPANCAGTAP